MAVQNADASQPEIADAFIKIVVPPNPRDFGVQRDQLNFTSTPIISGVASNAQYMSQDVFGGSEPIKLWQHTGMKTFALATKFFVQNNPQRDVIDRVRWCEALQYPISVEGGSNAFHPPIVLVRIGSWFRARCVVTQVSYDPNLMATVGDFPGNTRFDRRNFFDLLSDVVSGVQNPEAAPAPLATYPVSVDVSLMFEVTTQILNRAQADANEQGTMQPSRYTFQTVASGLQGFNPEDIR